MRIPGCTSNRISDIRGISALQIGRRARMDDVKSDRLPSRCRPMRHTALEKGGPT